MIIVDFSSITMSKNDLLLLDPLIELEHKALKPKSSTGAFFEFFSASQILRDYMTDPEEIESGIVGQESNKSEKGNDGEKGTDGGIDAMYVIVNGQIIRDIDQANDLKELEEPPRRFEVVCIQCTRDDTFEMARVLRMAESAKEIFDMSRQAKDYSERFNDKLIGIIDIFRAAHHAVLSLHASVHIYFHLVTRGDTCTLDIENNGTRRKAEELESSLPKILGTVENAVFEFVGAKELYAYSKKAAEPIQHTLNSYINMGGASGKEAIALVSIGEIYSLITEKDELREVLFEWNVRDYVGQKAVNRRIRETLSEETETPFWWLNNGITILVDKLTIVNSRILQITGPRIVNGLQTSNEIFRFINNNPDKKDDQRLAMVRVIQSNNPETENKIIRATNSQNPMPVEALRASDEIQKQIEDFFRKNGLHYDRRKNSWRKTKPRRPIAEVVGISEMAQSFGAIVLKEPNTSRARPSSYFKRKKYEKVFNEKTDLKIYLFCAKLRKRTESFLLSREPVANNRTNLLFYCLTCIGMILNRQKKRFNQIDANALPDELFDEALSIVNPIYKTRSADGRPDQAASASQMIEDLKLHFGVKDDTD